MVRGTEFEYLFIWLMGIFSLVLVSTILGIFSMLFNVKCHKCGGKTKTMQNREHHLWVAHCKKCDIVWNLNIGTNTGTNMR